MKSHVQDVKKPANIDKENGRKLPVTWSQPVAGHWPRITDLKNCCMYNSSKGRVKDNNFGLPIAD